VICFPGSSKADSFLDKPISNGCRGTRIGVLGGIGPESTAEFYSKLINELQKRGLVKSNEDYPQIIVNSIPAPELIYDDINEEELVSYIEGLKELDKFGVDFIVIICNTIHLYYDLLQKNIKTRIIDLRKEMNKFLMKNKIQSVFILGTPNTIKKGLYRFAKIKSYEPNIRELSILTESIFNFNRGFERERQIKAVKEICNKYLKKGAQTIILGCTEFAVMLGNEDFPNINSIDILVNSTIEYMGKTK